MISIDNLILRMRNLSKINWQYMPSNECISTIIEPLNMVGMNNLESIIKILDDRTFDLLTKKLWTEQDKLPDFTDPNPSAAQDTYEETLPIVILLDRIVKFRLGIEQDPYRKNEFIKQIGLLNMILSPRSLSKVAHTQRESSTLDDECEYDECEVVCDECGECINKDDECGCGCESDDDE